MDVPYNPASSGLAFKKWIANILPKLNKNVLIVKPNNRTLENIFVAENISNDTIKNKMDIKDK